jgi:hypothetical protein
MTSSFHGGMLNPDAPQANAGSRTIELPSDRVASRQ